MLIITNINVEASCPPGFTQTTVRLTIAGCDYDVEVCYKCGVTYPGEIIINWVTEVDHSCNNFLSIEQIIQQAKVEISSAQFIYSNLCVGGGYMNPPCNELGTSYAVFTIPHKYCWSVQWIYYFGEMVLRYTPCDENAECNETIGYCWNGTGYDKVYSHFTGPQSPPCELEAHEITIPPYPYGPSECFILLTVPCGIE